MNIGPFSITRRPLTERKYQTLSSVSGSRLWWPILSELTTGGWQRNEDVSLTTILRNPTLYAIVTLISGDIAKLRPMLVEQDEAGIWEEVESPAFSPVLAQPNNYQTWIDFAEWYVLSKLLHGNAYVLKSRNGRGNVDALYVLDPCRVTPMVAPDRSVFYQLSADPLSDAAFDVTVPAREIIHDVMCPLFHPLVGVSPIYAAGFPALQGMNIRNQSDKFFKNGSRPGGILLVPGTLTQPQADEMKTNWKSAFSGDNQGDVAVLTGGMKYEPMAMTAEQSQLIDQLRMTDEDICKCFHMPRHKVGVGPDPTYTNIEALNQQYYTDCLQKHISKFQHHLTYGLELDNVQGKTLAVELDLDDLLLMDTAAKAEAASKAVTAGLSYNEARLRFWDAGPVAGGESPLAQQQNYSLEALAKRDASDDPFGTKPRELPPAPDPAPEDAAKVIDLLLFKSNLREARKRLVA